MVGGFILCLRIVEAAAVLVALGLDAAIITQTGSALASGQGHWFAENDLGYSYDYYLPDEIPEYYPGWYLSVSAASLGIASLLGLAIGAAFKTNKDWRIAISPALQQEELMAVAVDLLNFVMFAASFAELITANKMFQFCHYPLSSSSYQDQLITTNTGIWLCVIPDVLTGVDIICCILFLITLIYAICDAAKKRPQEPTQSPQAQVLGQQNFNQPITTFYLNGQDKGDQNEKIYFQPRPVVPNHLCPIHSSYPGGVPIGGNGDFHYQDGVMNQSIYYDRRPGSPTFSEHICTQCNEREYYRIPPVSHVRANNETWDYEANRKSPTAWTGPTGDFVIDDDALRRSLSPDSTASTLIHHTSPVDPQGGETNSGLIYPKTRPTRKPVRGYGLTPDI